MTALVKLAFYRTFEINYFHPLSRPSRIVGMSWFSGAAAHLDGP